MNKFETDFSRDTSDAGYYSEQGCSLDAFEKLIDRQLAASDVPFAAGIENNIPIYECASIDEPLSIPSSARSLMAEWARNLLQGSGVIVLKQAFSDPAVIDQVSRVYEAIIADEKTGNRAGADHFAAAGSNDRIWNSLQKLCLADSRLFVHYFGNRFIDAASRAWLGPAYQMTAQVNLVHPGGAAQSPHRDYHLGFMTPEQASLYPAYVHALSPVLTLQGAIAHCDMPVESGPTKLLPFSQSFGPGYLAYGREDFKNCFEERFVQVPLEKGDLLFFNPALFHAAGDNRSENIERMANLLQVSSCMGIALEAIDRDAMCRKLYPALLSAKAEGFSQRDLQAALSACAEGYPFPTNLDTDPPIGGLAPGSQADLMREALSENWDPAKFNLALDAQKSKRKA